MTKLKGFLVDTAFYKMSTNALKFSEIDQGVCCLSDTVESMFKEVAGIQDTRETRVLGGNISNVDNWHAEESEDVGVAQLYGTLGFAFDAPRLNECRNIFELAVNKDRINALFNIVEVFFFYNKFIDTTAQNPLGRVADTAEAYNKAAGYISDNPDFGLGIDLNETDGGISVGLKTCKMVSRGEVFEVKRIVRRHATFTVTLFTDAERSSQDNFNIELWAEAAAFAGKVEEGDALSGKSYPYSTITDVILPCPYDKLYNLVTEYNSVSQFATSVSLGDQSVFHLTSYTFEDDAIKNIVGEYSRSGNLNSVVASDDHTGVYSFTTDYHAYPESNASYSFNITFKVVYKGAKPSHAQAKAAIRAAIRRINPNIFEEQWRAKLPGIIAAREYVLIPLWDKKIAGLECYQGILDATPSAITNLMNSVITMDKIYEYSRNNIQDHVEFVLVSNQFPPVAIIPKLDTDLTSSLSEIFADYKGIYADSASGGGEISDQTVNFTNLLLELMGKAYRNDATMSQVSDFNGNYVAGGLTNGCVIYVKCKQ